LVGLGTDPDSDSLSVTAVSGTSTNGGGVALADGVITYTPAPGHTGEDAFTYTLSDNHAASATGTVLVNVVTDASYNLVSIALLGGGDAELQYHGIPYNTYALDWTHELTPAITWVPLATNQAASTGLLLFTNTPSGTNDFYRTRWVSGQ
jgi:hypothetical protein